MNEFRTQKSRDKIGLCCKTCGDTYYKAKNEIQRQAANPKLRLVSDYCSPRCRPGAPVRVQCAYCGHYRYKRSADMLRTNHSFCNHACAAAYKNKHRTKAEQQAINLKISITSRGRRRNDGVKRDYRYGRPLRIKSKTCTICGNPFNTVSNAATCGTPACRRVHLSNQLKGKTGGPRRGGGFGKHSKYVKPDGTVVHCQSTMERAFCVIADTLSLTWGRNTRGFPYIDLRGRERNYYPDFYAGDKLVELKGYETMESKHKISAANVPSLVVLKTRRYGGNWEDIVQNPTLLLAAV